VDPDIRDELVEVSEPVDVANLGDQRGADRRTDPRDRLEPASERAVEQAGNAGLSLRDLLFEQVVLGDQQLHLESELRCELRRRDRVLRQGDQLFGFRRPHGPVARTAIRIGERGHALAGDGRRGRGEPEDRERARAGDFLDGATATVPLGGIRPLPGGSVDERIAELLIRVGRAGSSAYVVDVTAPDIASVGLHVVSSCEELAFPWERHPELARRLADLVAFRSNPMCR